MRTLDCTGTLGDTYINLCKIYRAAQKDKILCRHYTKHKNWEMLIANIYSLCSNIEVKFLKKMPNRSIIATFRSNDKVKLDIEYFPVFSDLVRLRQKFNLPDRYTCMCMKSGRPSQKRQIDKHLAHKIIAQEEYIVTVGTDMSIDTYHPGHYNLIDKTSLLEAMAIVSGCSRFYGFQGLFCYLALSQKILTTVYVKYPKRDLRAFRIRCPQEWQKYLVEIVQL